MMSSSSSGSRGRWEDYVEQAREKLPEPPPGIMDAYVKWIPWIAIIFGAIGFIFTVVFGLFGAVLSPFLVLAGAEGLRAGMGSVFAIVLGGIGSALSFVGGWKMKAHERHRLVDLRHRSGRRPTERSRLILHTRSDHHAGVGLDSYPRSPAVRLAFSGHNNMRMAGESPAIRMFSHVSACAPGCRARHGTDQSRRPVRQLPPGCR